DALHLAGEDPFDSYDRAIEIRRSYFEALFAKANAHLVRGQYEQAREALQRARKIHPEYVDAVALLARTYLEEADLERGIEIA
ncbi:tetratricopeptide repeat protein, partial [Shewanella sp. A3A]|nr:tetratricopeptide repeat protein [Shewanella ferrihydritica]